MSIINYYSDPTIISWNTDVNGNRVSVSVPNEPIRVIDGRAVLNGIPDKQYRVIIDGYVEIDIKEKLTQPNQYKVDYTHSFIFFHESVGDISLYASYYSRGVWRIPASKVWSKLNDFGEVEETLADFADKVQGAVDIANDIQGTIDTANQTKQNLDDSITTGNTTINNLDNLVAQTDFATINTKISALQGIRIHEGTTEPTDTKFWYDPSDD